MTYDVWIDYHARRSDGLTPVLAKHARPGVRLAVGEHVVVGADDAEPAVAEVRELRDNGLALVRVLEGPASDHLHPVKHSAPS